MCHLVAACPNMNVEKYPGDIMGPDYHAISVVKEPLEIRGPIITTPLGLAWESTSNWQVVESNLWRAIRFDGRTHLMAAE